MSKQPKPPSGGLWVVRRMNPGCWIYGPIAVGVLADTKTRRRWLYANTHAEAVLDADRRARAQ